MREQIVDEVIKILHGPIGGPGERIDKNPLDFYSVGVLFPRILKPKDIESNPEISISDTNDEDDDHNNPDQAALIDDAARATAEEIRISQKRAAKEAEESEDSGEFELTTKFRPSAAGLSVITDKNPSFKLTVQYATYKRHIDKKEIQKNGAIQQIDVPYFIQNPHKFIIDYTNGGFHIEDLEFEQDGKITFIYLDQDKKTKISITTRPYHQGKKEFEIRTFTLINNLEVATYPEQKKPEDCLYQPVISIEMDKGFEPFEDVTDLSLLSPEDINLKLLYRHYKKYALGHGISVNWDDKDGIIKKVFTQVLPQEKVNGVELDPPVFKGKNILFMKRLGGQLLDPNYSWQTVSDELTEFISLYENWIYEQKVFVKQNPENLPEEFLQQAKGNIINCDKLFSRMHQGIELLNNNPEARKAFEDANRAMFMQRVMADFSRHRRDNNRVQQNNDNFDDALPDYAAIYFGASSEKIWKDGKLFTEGDHNPNGRLARWRPFQLAFLLSQIEGIIDPSSNDRDTVDLIWFPTGGGKTEAYLGLTAFTIFYRRLNAKKSTRDPDNGAGVTVLMRYTLRLLNKQQFERASIIICACDLIRRQEPANYGEKRISNGIWMGRSMTPNNENDQIQDYGNYINNINQGNPPETWRNSPPLLSCPCCGNRLIKENKNGQVIGRWGYIRRKNNRNQPTGRYLISCTNSKCDFFATNEAGIEQSRLLPVHEVDENIYQERPTLLFSTVDKFVQLAWNNKAFSLFNIELNAGIKRVYPAPELIIQDELHLISSALGTVYGVYEIVIDKLCREQDGTISKIIGATATVRNAEDQCRRLYARKGFLQFPPPGTNADDSFYSQKIIGEDKKNRLYVGFMPSGITTSTALIRLASVLLERIPTFDLPNEEVDKHFTLVVYFNALKELGKFRTFLADDIVAYRKLLANHFSTFIKPYKNNELCELSSVMTADDITTGLDQLEKTTLPKGIDFNNGVIRKLFQKGIRSYSDLCTAKGAIWHNEFINQAFFNAHGLIFINDFQQNIQMFLAHAKQLFSDISQPIHIAPATNMISVGVDIPRLNTMIINGQPKTTAEYIQASSRVGRQDPGVVFTFLAPTKNRDRSHYEQFKAFHQAYYYFVESSSVTPYSVPALEKVLPTVLIALTRSLYLYGNGGQFNASVTLFTNFIHRILDEIEGRGVAIYGAAYKDQIKAAVEKVRDQFLNKLQALNGPRRIAEHKDFMERNPLTGRWETRIQNQDAVYNAPAQFTDTILKDHIHTMVTLRNVESSTEISIKS